jgi:MFS family permease
MSVFLFINGAIQGAYGQPNVNPTPEKAAVTWIMVDKPVQSKAVIACTYIFVAIFATTWGPVSWTYPAEIYPSQVRAEAVSLATASCWGWNTGLAFFVPPLLTTINWKMYMLFASFNACGCIHMFFMAPETKGKTLEEMEEVFERPAWKTQPHGSMLEELQRRIEEGNLKIDLHHVETVETTMEVKH